MTGPETGSATAAAARPLRRRPSRTVLALVVLVVALSAAVRFADLARYPGTVFDEYYYVHDARAILHGDLAGAPPASWRPVALRSVSHPDLAKLAIGAGIAAFGDHAWGWRLPSALAGTVLIALVFPLARRMGLGDEWALAALVLTAADPMLMLESRLAVLDIFVALGTALVVYCALRAVQSGFRPGWLVACGAAVGAAIASKWSGAFAVPAALVILLPGLLRKGRAAVSPAVLVVTLALVPAGVYLASYLPYFAAGHGLGDWAHLQVHMATYGWGVKGDRSFASAAITWPFDVHPIWYRWSVSERGTTGLFAVGNILVWWTAATAWVVLGILALLRRDWRLGLTPALVAALYLPWLVTSRQAYIYYMVPVIPFLAILVATALSRVAGAPWSPAPGSSPDAPAQGSGSRRWRRFSAWAFCLACLVVGALFVPFVLGLPVPFEYYARVTLFTTWK
jgi:dolichyl-phosphate-mannose-protein mannosyltransferase